MRNIAFRAFAAILIAASFFFSAFAAGLQDPYDVINTAAGKLFPRINNERAKIKADPLYMRTIIREELMPYVDSRFAAFRVIGTNLKSTTPEQREKFTAAFTDYIVATYADALLKYDKQTMEVEPKKPVEGKLADIGVKIKETGKDDMNLVFKLRKNSKTGEWKCYDMVAEGISLLSSKHNELAGKIRDEGIDSVRAELEKHVSDLASGKKADK